MKKLMILLAAAALVAVALPVLADDDRVIGVEQLPASAQQFLRNHFPEAELSFAKVDEDLFGDEYKVVFTDGTSVDFDREGVWLEIDAGRGAVPAAVVPQQIRESVDKRFAGRSIRKIERERRGFEVTLDNGLNLEFDRTMQLVDIDD